MTDALFAVVIVSLIFWDCLIAVLASQLDGVLSVLAFTLGAIAVPVITMAVLISYEGKS